VMVNAAESDATVVLGGSINVTMNLYEPGVGATGRTKVSDVLEAMMQLAKFVPVPSDPNVALQLPAGNSIPVTVTVEPKYAAVGAKFVRDGRQCAACVNSSAATKKSKLRGIEPGAGNRVNQ